MIRIDAIWLSTAPLDMRAGTDTLLARVVAVFGAASRAKLLDSADRDARSIVWRDAKIDKLTFEIAQLRRLKYAARSEKSEALDAGQKALFEEAVEADIAAIEAEIEELRATLPAKPDAGDKQTPKRAPLPERLPRVERHHEVENTTCACGCTMSGIGEDVTEKLDYTPGVFTVERMCAASEPAPIAARWCRLRCRRR